MFGRLGTTEIVIIAVIVLLILGPTKLPEFGRAVGRTLREFRGAAKEPARDAEAAKRAVEEPVKDVVKEVAGDPGARS